MTSSNSNNINQDNTNVNIQSTSNRKLSMHYWYMDEHGSDERRGTILHGVVTGHGSIADSTFIHTSRVQNTHIDVNTEELIVETKNSVYHCPLAYCEFAKQEERKDLVPNYDSIKQAYEGKIESPSIAAGNVLLVMSNFDHHFFHSLFCQPAKGFQSLTYHASPNVNSFQDDFLIQTDDHRIELCYLSHFQNVEFITQETDDMPLYIENIGDIPLHVKARCGLIEINPRERKKISKDNVQSLDMTMTLPSGDLFPDGLLD